MTMDKFNAFQYFEQIHNSLKTLKGFHFCRVSDKKTMEDLIHSSRKEEAFFCVDDTEDGQIMQKAGGYVTRRVYFVWILKKYFSRGSSGMINQDEAMQYCRNIYEDIVSKIITDKDKQNAGLTYVETRFPFWEIPHMIFPEAAGLYFSITVDTPMNLCLKPENWE